MVELNADIDAVHALEKQIEDKLASRAGPRCPDCGQVHTDYGHQEAPEATPSASPEVVH